MQGGDTKKAIDCCVLLNQWDQAVTLAQQHNFPQIEGLLAKYASHLLEKDKQLEAIELYRKANHHTEAAKLLTELAQKSAALKVRQWEAGEGMEDGDQEGGRCGLRALAPVVLIVEAHC